MQNSTKKTFIQQQQHFGIIQSCKLQIDMAVNGDFNVAIFKHYVYSVNNHLSQVTAL